MSRALLLLALCAPAVAHAELPRAATIEIDGQGIPAITDGSLGGATIYMNQCVGGCTITPGPDNAALDMSAIPMMLSHLDEYANWQPGEWDAVVQCVREVYSPYNINVVDQRPPAGAQYSMIYVAGRSSDVQFNQQGVGGVALLTRDCTPSSLQGVAYAFTDQINVFSNEDGSRVTGMCWIVAQETAHVYGLDHEFEWADDLSSACADPMTYRDECGGQKFFRNRAAHCGELNGPRVACGPTKKCRATQNSHTQLLGLFGPSQAATPLVAPPTIALVDPIVDGGVVTAGTPIVATAASQRGVDHVQLYVNGFPWGNPVPGAPFGHKGQPESTYTAAIPDDLPDGVCDVQMVAFDDLGASTASATVRVTKGAACTDASHCAKGQTCDGEGRCAWAPATAADGDHCSYDQQCTSLLCEQGACTHGCLVGDPADPDACTGGRICTAFPDDETRGVCLTDASSGCCSGSRGGATALFGLLAVLAARRRRR